MKKSKKGKIEHDILSQEEINALLSASKPEELKKVEFPTARWEEGLEARIDNYSFREGQWIYVQWTRGPFSENHIFEDDALFGFIIDVGADINYHYLFSQRSNKKYLSANTKTNAKPVVARKLLSLYDPDKAKKLKQFGVNAGIKYEPSTRLLIEGVSLNPYETGFGKIAIAAKLPRLYEMQQGEGQVLLDKNYIKAVHGDVYLDWVDIRRGLEENNRSEYLEVIQGSLGIKLQDAWKKIFDPSKK
ncbi:hypothetical protein HYV89_05765 [Candidatus Woesearchaeota archaeon]|nr:hypothetical protein [Candidatus Woesearchaeota archaeon]